MNSYIETAIDGATSTLHALAWIIGASVVASTLLLTVGTLSLLIRPVVHEVHVRRTSRRLHREAQ